MRRAADASRALGLADERVAEAGRADAVLVRLGVRRRGARSATPDFDKRDGILGRSRGSAYHESTDWNEAKMGPKSNFYRLQTEYPHAQL